MLPLLTGKFFFVRREISREGEKEGRHNDARHTAPSTRPTPTVMSSSAPRAADTATEGDTVSHAERALNEMLFKGADCAKCGAVRSTEGANCKQCACKLVCYCSKECQRGDWADHKARCTYKKPNATAHQIDPQEAIPGLPDHLVVTHILRTEYFDDPADLARLPSVSRAMRNAVAGTGLRFKELIGESAANIGCVSAVERLLRRGILPRAYLCHAAARSRNSREVEAVA